jgi:hypothetical protein
MSEPNKNATKVCSQCKHFYAAIETHDTTDATEPKLFSDEIRLCYEFHWCNASSPVCDSDFKPLGDVEMSQPDAELMFDDFNAKYPDVQEAIQKAADKTQKQINFWGKPLSGTYSFLGNPQKEIQYVYIGLLQENQDTVQGTLVEVPTEIDGVATNYRRVEMMPLDWYTEDGEILINGVDIEFPEPQIDWGPTEYFGVYNSLIGGDLIESNRLNEGCMKIRRRNLIVFRIGALSVLLDTLKGGE